MKQTINLVSWMFAYSIGVSFVSLLPKLPSISILCVIGIFTLFLIVIFIFSSYTRLFLVVNLLVGVMVGVSYGKWLQVSQLPENYEGCKFQTEGRVVSLPALIEKSTRFDFSIACGDCYGKRKVRLRWYDAPEIKENQIWRLCIKLRSPHGFASPGAFDFEAWAVREGLRATGYVISGELISEGKTSIRQGVYQWLTKSALPGSAGVIKALLIGDKSGISADQWQLLNATGATHLVVISGLHIGLMALFGFWLAALLARSGLLPLKRLALPRISAILSLLLACIYAFLAGFGIPVQRALVMAVIATVGPICGFKPSPITLLVVALAAVVTLDPLAVTSAGFWYSFTAVGALIYGLSARYGATSLSEKWVKPQWLVFCVLTPLLLFNGQQVSLLSPLVNLIAIPYIGLLVVPLLMLAALLSILSSTLSLLILSLIDWLLECFWWLLRSAADIVLVFPVTNSPELVAVIFAVAGALLLLSPLPRCLRLLSPIFFLPWLFPYSKSPEFAHADITVLDVGQGLSVVIRTQHHTMIYDTGDAFSESFNAASCVIVPYLQSFGVKRLNKIVISHGDKDHSGGLIPLLDKYDCADISCGTRVPYLDRSFSWCRAGQYWQWDGVDFEVLAGGGTWKKNNDRSCVLKITAQNESFLLAGDIGSRVEEQLVVSGKPLQATVLLAPHHGSCYSTSSRFLKAVNPQKVVFSSGYKNQFGHPSKATLARVIKCGAEIWNTAEHGSLSFKLGDGVCDIEAYRHSHRRYWWY